MGGVWRLPIQNDHSTFPSAYNDNPSAKNAHDRRFERPLIARRATIAATTTYTAEDSQSRINGAALFSPMPKTALTAVATRRTSRTAKPIESPIDSLRLSSAARQSPRRSS